MLWNYSLIISLLYLVRGLSQTERADIFHSLLSSDSSLSNWIKIPSRCYWNYWIKIPEITGYKFLLDITGINWIK